MDSQQAPIELFHLLFLRQLEKQLDKQLYALKGGCNLRFFFKSIRYSEHIDFDVATISEATLEKKIHKILAAVDFKRILLSSGIEIIQFNAETTQRWKVLLKTKQSELAIPTKIEFSRRKMERGLTYVAVDSTLINGYKLYPIICNHYDGRTAFLQKIRALIGRTETQARDVFDLMWLLSQGVTPDLVELSDEERIVAIDNANGITYEDYKGQVVAYLMGEYQPFYDSREKWNEIISQVVDAIKSK